MGGQILMGAIAYYIFVLPLSYLPLGILYIFTDFFYLLLISFIPYRKKIITQNLQRAFPNKSSKEIAKIRRKFYRHFTQLLAEGIKNLSIKESELKKRFKVKNPELFGKLYQENKSVLLVAGHYNNWEWLVTSQSLLFPHKAVGIGMPLSSKFWDKKINARRERFGMHVVHAKNFKEKIKQYTSPIAILLLSDQSPPNARKSYWTKFLNQPTAVLFGAEQLANTYNYAVVYFETKKVKRGYYEMELKLISDKPRELNYGEITEKHVELLEKTILKNPEYWLWSHKRWKRDVPTNLQELKQQQREAFNIKFNR